MRGGTATPHQSYVAKCEGCQRRLLADEVAEFALIYGKPVGWFFEWPPGALLPSAPRRRGRPSRHETQAAAGARLGSDDEARSAPGAVDPPAPAPGGLAEHAPPAVTHAVANPVARGEHGHGIERIDVPEAARGPRDRDDPSREAHGDTDSSDAGQRPAGGPIHAPRRPRGASGGERARRAPTSRAPEGPRPQVPPGYRRWLSALMEEDAGQVILGLSADHLPYLEAYNDLGETPLYEAVRRQRWGAMAALAALGADPFYRQGGTWVSSLPAVPGRARRGTLVWGIHARHGRRLTDAPRTAPDGHPPGYEIAPTPWALAVQLVEAAARGVVTLRPYEAADAETMAPEVEWLRQLIIPSLSLYDAGTPTCRLYQTRLRRALRGRPGAHHLWAALGLPARR